LMMTKSTPISTWKWKKCIA